MKLYSCIFCVNWIGKVPDINKPTCKAYPEGIPEEILTGEVDHRTPYKGDHGIMFEKLTE